MENKEEPRARDCVPQRSTVTPSIFTRYIQYYPTGITKFMNMDQPWIMPIATVFDF